MSDRRIVIFGGAFSPPTLAHEAIIAALLGMSQFGEVWVMPSGDRLDKDMTTRDSDRLAMLEQVKIHRFQNNPKLKISDFELRMPRPSQTYRTIKRLTQHFPHAEFWFAYGPDSYLSMPDWLHGTELQQNLNIVLFSSGGPLVPTIGGVVHLCISDNFADTSSTEARRTGNYRQLTKIVSPPVANYIRDHSLYSLSSLSPSS